MYRKITKRSDSVATEKTKKQTTEKQKTQEPKGKPSRSKKDIVLYSFIGVLAVLTVLFAYNVVDYFYLDPIKASGKPQYGDRLNDLTPVSESIINDAVSYGNGQSGVKTVDITVEGMVVYIDVRVDSTTAIATAKASAEKISDYLITAMDKANANSSNAYNFQLVVANEDPQALVDKNRAEELEYIKNHDVAVVEQVIAYAEEYPTATNLDRANKNIVYLEKTYPEEAAAFQKRVAALTELTAEQEEALGEIPTLEVEKEIKPSSIAEYPSWGTLNKETNKYDWK